MRGRGAAIALVFHGAGVRPPFEGLVGALTRRPAWQSGELRCAESADPDLWFRDTAVSIEAASAICRRCPVREACLADAMADPPAFGVWAGLTAREIREASPQGRPRAQQRREYDPEVECVNGHERGAEAYQDAQGKWRCRGCKRASRQRAQARKRDEAARHTAARTSGPRTPARAS